jgi:OHCU decarboxylase
MAEYLAWLNELPAQRAQAEFLKCCGSTKWAKQLVAARPFKSREDLSAKAERVWWSLDKNDWLEAFFSHPKIGEKKAAAETDVKARKWAEQEQSSISEAAAETKTALAELNEKYDQRFGYIFIVCATGKSSEEMLANLGERLHNEPEKEIRIAAEEQAKITQLRLQKLLDKV